ncbi:helix-turn-helix domain-containing protein [Rhizobium sp. C1]|uniref:helix-turn-helix domain-containing protein n=1 Tax=Rhizobium sp. C1 TaxID=1349799 RepID=UPI001E32A264|nr:helix-turn-helix transcriptional regulator [Rhizobium sp. C1]MCD2178515.1 helix-turn-helix domain-containing protein [Rhizobium sp. C1]
MTPFGEAMRELRRKKGVTQKEMATALGVSQAYLSALEHGNRSAPSFDFIQRVAGYFNIIWDDLEDLMRIAGLSHPRVVIDTAGLDAAYTALANRLAREIRNLDPETLAAIDAVLNEAASLKP